MLRIVRRGYRQERAKCPNSVEQSHFWKAISRRYNQEFPVFSKDPKYPCNIYNSLLQDPVLSEMSVVHISEIIVSDIH